jgi:hypothetical protein
MLKNIVTILALLLVFMQDSSSQTSLSAIKLARVKYSGGSDWYNDQSAEVNLLKYVRANTNINVEPKYEYVDLATDDLFQYPLIFMTGHGNMKFSDKEQKNLRAYLESGGFLYVDDDYGLDKFFRKEIERVFPDNKLSPIPFSHDIFNCHFRFPNGVPKTHEHDDKAPQSLGIFINDRLAVFYTEESNPSDGWADPAVHNDPPAKREESMKFGTNIIVYALTH